MIVLRGLEKRFPGSQAPALAPLDLEVAEGELLVLVGPSGCGKSTALRLIAGLEEPSAGRVELQGRDLSGISPERRDVAMVFQGYALYPHKTVAQNIAFPLEMRRVPAAERADKVRRTARLVGLEDKLDRLPGGLSGGERQRVAMARAVVREPRVFLFDEPLSNLDAKLRTELRVELSSLLRRLGTTAIYVTHDQAEAMTMGDRVAVLDGGRLQQVASPREVYERPANLFVAGFVGTPAMNLWPVTIERGRAHAPGLDLPAPEGLGERATVGFRPEHLHLGEPSDGEGDVRGEVRAVESFGAETLVHLAPPEAEATPHEASAAGRAALMRARLPGFAAPTGPTRFRIGREHLLWFDAESGARLEGT
ncbi:MAG: ABC transporter ATP-binding protein [Polyangiaceae bacterium]